jgi:hypothetical protein
MERRRFLAGAAGASLAFLAVSARSRRLALTTPVHAAEPPVMTVGTRSSYAVFGLSDGSNRWMVSRLFHAVPAGARNLQLVYGNFAPIGGHGLEADGPNPIVISAAVEFPEGNLLPVHFNGMPSIRLLPGQPVISDPLNVSIPPGGRCFTRTQVTADAPPYKWPLTRYASLQVGDWSVTGPDPAKISDAEELRHRQFKCFGPYNILGAAPRRGPAVVILGDSVVCGEPGPGDQFGDRGYIERALSTELPWCNLAVPGPSAAAFLKESAKQRGIIGHNFTHAISALGIADIRIGNEQLIKRNLHELWTNLADQGLIVFQTTITTDTKSQDKWTTIEGQTVANPNFLPGGIYHRINEWIRSTPAPLHGIFDPAAVLETAVDSGIWLAPDHQPLTRDGPHPDALAATMAAKAVTVAEFLR